MSDELLAACKAQHQAIDTLFAMLLAITHRLSDEPVELFYPSKSGQPWEAAVQGARAIAAAEARRVLLEIPILDPNRVLAVAATAQPGSARIIEATLGPVSNRLPYNAKLVLRITLEELWPGLEIDHTRTVEWLEDGRPSPPLDDEQREQLRRVLLRDQ